MLSRFSFFLCVFGSALRSFISFVEYCIAVLAENPNGNEVIIEDVERGCGGNCLSLSSDVGDGSVL